jgi:quinol-cytochrome oxidoreductase complex cytochrome b subunit
MARADRTPDPEPKQRGRLFWICVLVVIEFAVWTILAVAGASETIATVVALAVGVAFVVAFRGRIWGEDWKDQLAEQRARERRR